jgi:hypothetical protein
MENRATQGINDGTDVCGWVVRVWPARLHACNGKGGVVRHTERLLYIKGRTFGTVQDATDFRTFGDGVRRSKQRGVVVNDVRHG